MNCKNKTKECDNANICPCLLYGEDDELDKAIKYLNEFCTYSTEFREAWETICKYYGIE